jgi:D-alanine-D-alanine ligase
MMRNKKVAVLYGGLSAEREVSLRSGAAAIDALKKAGFTDIMPVDAARDLPAVLSLVRPDVCFNILHGTYGEDGRVQGLLELMGIPCTGSDSFSSTIAFDKLLSKVVFDLNGIPTPEYVQIKRDDRAPFIPCVVKPARQGSTIGISIVKDEADFEQAKEEAFRYDDRVVVEKFITGKELTISILSGKALPIIWINPKSGFYDYESKYTKGATDYLLDTGLSAEETATIQELSLKTFKSAGCSSFGRVDVIYDGRTPWVLEINTLPGLTETSLLPKAAAKAGIGFDELVTLMIQDALETK